LVALHLFQISFWFLKVPSFKWFLWKSTSKFPYLKACVIILRDLSSFQTRILNLPGCLNGWKFDRICILCYPFGFWHRPFCPSPFNHYLNILTITIANVNSLIKNWTWEIEYFNLHVSEPNLELYYLEIHTAEILWYDTIRSKSILRRLNSRKIFM